ncbi:macro domain-containing protein [Schleiferilactobacillus perolens]|uniref:Appr-1-p processing protein n=1 Tax=Schleiferilactobacillus perolens DSM 12744 TaxID=1423792 RepID=A0A0R1N278_9LACO|nr:macro domain-containing protein [Schleiferilactobacillus perolens]KRL14367.1 Appr-1-p processing protein [Schleiferilactobacillus perolens DSM 12744]
MLMYVTMNLFDSPAQVLVNTVNTVGVMGKGIALTFKKLYPDMFKEYRRFCEQGQLTVGKLWLYKTSGKWILNFPTKVNWRNRSKAEYIEAGLQKFVASYQERGITSISFPQLGVGNGGLDWEKTVKPLMEKYLAHLPIPVYIHLYEGENSKPEYANISEMRQWLDSDPSALSVEEFKDDLINAWKQPTFEYRSHRIQMENEFTSETNDGTSAVFMKITDVSGQIYAVSQSDIADLWTRLRDQGVVTAMDLPEPLQQGSESDFFFSLLAQVPYVKCISVGVNHSKLNAISLRRDQLPNQQDTSKQTNERVTYATK